MNLLQLHQSVKLGRSHVVKDSRTPSLHQFLTAQPPAPPLIRDWTKQLSGWGMMANDQYGCCTVAGAGHAVQVWELNVTGTMPSIPDATILQYYQSWDGWNPNNSAATDNGGVELDVLKAWKNGGFAGRPLTGFVSLAPNHMQHVQMGINYFGGAYIGVALPNSAQGQAVWDAADGADGVPGSWGGHCVFVAQYDQQGLTCITWGALQRMTWDFWNKYVDEAYALLSPDFLVQSTNPLGLNVSTLLTYLEAIN